MSSKFGRVIYIYSSTNRMNTKLYSLVLTIEMFLFVHFRTMWLVPWGYILLAMWWCALEPPILSVLLPLEGWQSTLAELPFSSWVNRFSIYNSCPDVMDSLFQRLQSFTFIFHNRWNRYTIAHSNKCATVESRLILCYVFVIYFISHL